MIVGVMQPYLFPYIGYWQLINAVDKFVIYDDVNYIKGGYINRNSILLNGSAHLITLSLIQASPNKLINEIAVEQNRGKLLKTIEHAYKKAPHYNSVYPIIEECINCSESSLEKFICFSLENISKFLDMNTNFIYSSDIEKDNSLKAQDKIINICKKLEAKKYINAIGGQSLYEKSEFDNYGIDLKFIKAGNIQYKQFKNDYIANLSIIDILMFNDVEVVKDMLGNYELL